MTRGAEPVPDDPALPERVTATELYRQMWHFAQGARVPLVVSSLMLVGSQLIKLLVPWFAAKAIEQLQHSSGATGMRVALQWVAGIVGLYVACWVLHGPGRVIERSVAVRVRRAIADRLYLHLSRAPLAWHEAQHSAALAHRVSQASGALSNFTQSQFVYLQNAVNLVGPLLALALLSAWTGAIALAGFCLVALTIVGFDRALMRLATEENAAERRSSAAMIDSLGNVATVLSLRLGEATRRLLARRLDAVVAPLRRSIRLNEWKWCGVDLLTVTLSWGLVVVYAWRYGQERGQGSALMLGGIFMVYQYAQQASGVIGSLASNLQNFARMRVDFASAAPIWVAPQRHETSRHETLRPCTAAPRWRRIDLCNLTYEHSSATAGADGQRAGLKHVSLRLQAGERIALVGPSGSGKSTLLRLLAGLYAPSQGHIEVDGVVSLHQRDLSAFATLIPQESQIFEATVRENLGFDFGHGDAELQAAAHTASFDAVLQTLPLGLDSPLAQAGANLSGGQRQRLGLARGVLAAQGSSVLLLDEPTSALDPLTEALVFDRLAAAFAGACVIASVHRMSLLDRFDRVVLLVGGQVVDSGTQAELLARQPLLREMVGMAALADPPRATTA